MPGAAAKAQFLGAPLTAGYKPTAHAHSLPLWYHGQRGFFTLNDVEVMRRDPRVRLALRVLKAPLHRARWAVEADDPRVKDYVDRLYHHFWQHSLDQALKFLDFGHLPAEVLWGLDEADGLIRYKALREVHPRDADPLEVRGRPWGFDVA